MNPEKFANNLSELFADYLTEHANSLIISTDFKVGKALKDKEIQSFEKKHAIVFPGKLTALFHDCNGVQIEWKIAKGEDEKLADMKNSNFYGRIRLLKMEEIMEGWAGTGWKDDLWFDAIDYTPDELIIKDLRPFDYYNSDDSGCACFLYRGGKLIDNVFTNSVDDGIHDLKINFDHYVDLMLMCYGVRGWQTVLHTPEPDEDDQYHALRIDILKKLNAHIPSFNFEEFMNKVRSYQGGK